MPLINVLPLSSESVLHFHICDNAMGPWKRFCPLPASTKLSVSVGEPEEEKVSLPGSSEQLSSGSCEDMAAVVLRGNGTQHLPTGSSRILERLSSKLLKHRTSLGKAFCGTPQGIFLGSSPGIVPSANVTILCATAVLPTEVGEVGGDGVLWWVLYFSRTGNGCFLFLWFLYSWQCSLPFMSQTSLLQTCPFFLLYFPSTSYCVLPVFWVASEWYHLLT